MVAQHIVRSYDGSLDLLRSKLLEMGREAADQISKSNKALMKRDSGLADVIIISDEKVNVLQQEAEELGIKILATRQPMAQDLRYVISCLKMASELERIADYAANIAGYISDLNGQIDLDRPIAEIADMAELAEEMLADIMDAFANADIQKAIAVWHRDDDIDRIYASLISDLRSSMSEDTDNIKAYTDLIFVARCCERIGDHITNLAENVHYIEYGKTYINGQVLLP